MKIRHQQTCPKNAIVKFSKQKGNNKRQSLGTPEGQTEMTKIWVNTPDFP